MKKKAFDSNRVVSSLGRKVSDEELEEVFTYLLNRNYIVFKRAFGGSGILFYDLKYTDKGYAAAFGYTADEEPKYETNYHISQTGNKNTAGIAANSSSISNNSSKINESINDFIDKNQEVLTYDFLKPLMKAKDAADLEEKEQSIQEAKEIAEKKSTEMTGQQEFWLGVVSFLGGLVTAFSG